MTSDKEMLDVSWRRSDRGWLWLGALGACGMILLVLFATSAASQRHQPPRRRAKTPERPKASKLALPPRVRYRSKRCARRWYGKRRSIRLAKERLPKAYERMKPLHALKCAPGRGDWLASQHERGEPFRHYHKGAVNRTNAIRTKIYIVPLGTFSPKQRQILRLTARYVKLFFSTPVVLMKPKKIKGLPRWARRTRFGSTQLHARYFLDRYLPRKRPEDSVATIAFTSQDLWPGRGWNFVYGMADLYRRIGVWSLHRMGKPSASQAAFRKALRRTVKIAVHELGHIFTVTHCVAYECVMNGAMHMGEVDHGPLALCPVCLRKICWNTRCKLKERFAGLMAFCKQQGLQKEAAFFQKLLAQWSQPKPPKSKPPKSAKVGNSANVGNGEKPLKKRATPGTSGGRSPRP